VARLSPVAAPVAESGVRARGVSRWVSIGPTHISLDLGATGRVHCIAIDPTAPSTIYVGAPAADATTGGSGLWKTTDGGKTWRPLTDDLPSLMVSAVAIDPSAPSRVYIVLLRPELSGSYRLGAGLFRSEDGGDSWERIFGDEGLNGSVLLVRPGEPETLYCTGNTAVFRSRDGGSTWTPALSRPGATVSDLVMDTNPARLFAALSHPSDGSVAGIYETTDGGGHWGDGPVGGGELPANAAGTAIRLALSRRSLYARLKMPGAWTLYRTRIHAGSGPSNYPWETGWNAAGSIDDDPIPDRLWSWIAAVPAGDPEDPDYVYAAGTELWVSDNGGSWFHRIPENTPDTPHADYQGFAVDPSNPDIIYVGTDGGIYRSSARGLKEWTFVGRGIANTEFYDIAGSVTNPRLVIGGTQDNGTARYDAGSTGWALILDGDGAGVDIDPTNADVLYAGGQNAGIVRSTDGGDDFSTFRKSPDDDPTAPDCFNPHFQVHPAHPSIVLESCRSLWRKDGDSDWTAILTLDSGTVLRSAVDARADLYYAGTSAGDVIAGRGGRRWQTIFSHKNGWYVSDIEIDLDDPTTVYVSFSGTCGETARSCRRRVYRLRRRDPAPTEQTVDVQDITFDLPWKTEIGIGLLVNTLAVDRMHPWTVYAGTTRGVFRGRSTDEGVTWSWTPYNDGLPMADVRDLEVHPRTGVMRAATFGRGAFEVDTDLPVGSVLSVRGRIVLLRVHDVGTGYGPPIDFIDGEVVVRLDSDRRNAFGFQLRPGAAEARNAAMLAGLRSAVARHVPVTIEYERTSARTGRILRVMVTP
jgi:photosystem II stability/assembly factor-like uncharacterized protein